MFNQSLKTATESLKVAMRCMDNAARDMRAYRKSLEVFRQITSQPLKNEILTVPRKRRKAYADWLFNHMCKEVE